MTSGGGSGFNIGNAYGRIILDASGVRAGIEQAQQSIRTGLSGMGQQFNTLGQNLQNWGDSFIGIGANITAATAPLIGFGIAGVNVASQFDSALAEIQARTGATAEEMQIIEQRALELAASTQFGANEVSAAFLEILASGSTVDEALQMLEPTLNAAAAGNMELGRTADIATNILAAYGLQAGDAEGVLDSLARASASSSATIGSLGEGFANIGPVANQFGLSVDETSAILAIFAENGISGAEAGTQLRSMLMNMTRDTPAVTAAWEELGVSLYDSQGNMRSMDTIMQELQASLNSGNFTMEQQNRLLADIGGSYGLVGISALTSSMSIGEMQQRMSEQSGAADIAAARMDTFRGSTLSLKSAFEALQINVMRPFMEQTLRPMIDRITEIIQRINEWAAANPELVAKIGAVVAAISALGPILIGVGFGMKQIGGIMKGLGTAMRIFAMGPIGLIIAAVGALAYAFVTDFGGIRTALMPILKKIGKALGGLLIPALEEAQEFLSDLWTNVKPHLETLAKWFTEDALPAIVDFVQYMVIPTIVSLGMFLSDLWAIVRPHLENFANWFITDGLPGILDFIQNTVIPVIGTFIQVVAGIWTTVAPMLLQFADWFLNTGLPAIASFVQDTVIPMVQTFVTSLQNIWISVGPFLASLLDWFITSGLPAISSFIATTVIPFIDGLITKLQEIWTVVGPVIAGLVDWFITTGFPQIQTFVEQTAIPFIDGFVTKLKEIWDVVGPVIANLVDWFMTTGLPAIQTFVQETIYPFIDGLVTKLGEIWTMVSPHLDSLKQWFETDGWPFIQSIIDGAKTAIDEVVTVLQNIWKNVEGPLNSLKTGFENTVGWVKKNVIDPIIERIEQFLKTIEDLKETAEDLNPLSGGLTAEEFAGMTREQQAGAVIASGGSFGGQYIEDRDTGGPGVAGQPYLIGPAQQGMEAFVPGDDGHFYPSFAENVQRILSGALNETVMRAVSGASNMVMQSIAPPQQPQLAPASQDRSINFGEIIIHANSRQEGEEAAQGWSQEIKEQLRYLGIGQG